MDLQPGQPVGGEPGVGQGRGSTAGAAVFRARTRGLRGQAASRCADLRSGSSPHARRNRARGPRQLGSRAERVDIRGVRPRREQLAAVQRPHRCPATRAERIAARGLPSPGVLAPVGRGLSAKARRDRPGRPSTRRRDTRPPAVRAPPRDGPWPQLPPQELTTHPGPTRGSRRTPVQPSHRASQRRPDPRRGSLQPAHRTGKRRASAPSRRLATGGPSPLGRLIS